MIGADGWICGAGAGWIVLPAVGIKDGNAPLRNGAVGGVKNIFGFWTGAGAGASAFLFSNSFIFCVFSLITLMNESISSVFLISPAFKGETPSSLGITIPIWSALFCSWS